LASAEIFDPAIDSVRSVVTMTSPRDSHTATGLKDGTVLVAGGWSTNDLLDTAEIFDPATSTFAGTPGKMGEARQNHSAILRPDGSVLLAGGADKTFHPLASVEVFNATKKLFFLGNHMINPRLNFVLAVTPNSDEVLAAGGALFAGGLSLVGRNDVEVLFPPPHILNVESCVTHPLTCQIIRQYSPFVLRAMMRHAMVLAPLPPGGEESVKDRKVPVICKITISGLNDAWDVALFSEEGMPLKLERSESRGAIVLTLAFVDAEKFRAMQESSYLAFQLSSKGEIGREYRVEAEMEVMSRPDLVR
jgi:Galactose oxidase, central domain